MTINNSVSTKNVKKTGSVKRYEPVPSHRESKSGVLAALVVILILILLGVLALIYVLPPKSINTENQGVSQGGQIPLDVNINSSANQDPTASWLTYDKSSSTYIFKYSPDWKLTEQDQVVRLSLPITTSSEIVFNVTTTTKNLDQYLAELDKVSATAFEGKPSVQVKSSTPFTAGTSAEIKGAQRVQTNLAAGLEQNVTYLYYNNRIFSIFLNSPKINSNLQDAYALFLSTVRFAPVSNAQMTASSSSSSTSSLPSSTPSSQPKAISYVNTKFNFQIQYTASSSAQQGSDGITLTNGKNKLIITGIKGAVPSLIKYQPNGAKIAGQVVIAGKDAVKLFTAKPTNYDSPYTQYVVPINDVSWLKIEYFGKDDVAKIFEGIIATLKFTK